MDQEQSVRGAQRAIKVLNQLIATCKDGEKGFRTAAGAVRLEAVKKLLKSYAAQRARFAVELQAEVERLGGQPAEGGRVTAVLQRGWMNLKALITGGDEGAVITECERSEEATVQSYQDALRKRFPAGIRPIVARQFDQVKEARARIHALEEACTRA